MCAEAIFYGKMHAFVCVYTFTIFLFLEFATIITNVMRKLILELNLFLRTEENKINSDITRHVN